MVQEFEQLAVNKGHQFLVKDAQCYVIPRSNLSPARTQEKEGKDTLCEKIRMR